MAQIVPRHTTAMETKDGDQASQLHNMLRSPNAEVRAKALQDLGRQGESGAAMYGYHEKAFYMIDDPSPQVQVAALAALGNMGSYGSTYTDYLVQKLGTQGASRDVRRAAVRALGALGPYAAGQAIALEQYLDDRDVELQGMVCAALGAVGATEARGLIADRLQSEDVEVVIGACHGLGCLGAAGDELLDPLNHKLGRVRAAAAAALAKDQQAVERHAARVAALAGDSDAHVRASAVGMISALGGRAAMHVPALGELLSSTDPGVRAAAAAALGGVGAPAASQLPMLEKLLADNAEDKSTHVMTIAGLQPRTPPVMRKPACAAASAIGVLGEAAQTAAPRLTDGLDSFDEEIRIQCACALAALGDAGSKYEDRVVALLADPAPMVKAAACYSLGAMAEATRLPSSCIADQVADLTRDPHPIVRGAAVGSLGKMGEEGANRIEAIADCVEDRVGSVRVSAIKALAGVGEVGQMFAGDVCRLMFDKETRVRLAAIEAMPKLGQRGAAFSREVAALLDEQSPELRTAGVKALGEMRGLEALGLLDTVLQVAECDESEQVREAAREASQSMRAIEDSAE